MNETDLKDFRNKLLIAIDEASSRRDLPQINILLQEARKNLQLDIAMYAEARKAHTNSDLDKALNFLDSAIQLNPHFAHAYNWKAIVLSESGKYEAAIDCLNRAIENLFLLNYAVF